jgi:hypothetical protein
MRLTRRNPSPVDVAYDTAATLAGLGAAAYAASQGEWPWVVALTLAAAFWFTRGRLNVRWLRRSPASAARRELLRVSRRLGDGSWHLARDPDVLLTRQTARVGGGRVVYVRRVTVADQQAVESGISKYQVSTVFTLSPFFGEVPITIGASAAGARPERLSRRDARLAYRLRERTGVGNADVDDLRELIRQVRLAEPLELGDADE